MKREMKIRFHLGAGPNKGKWRVEDIADGEVEFFCPREYTLTLFGAKLHNQKGTATKIKNGANKTVCAWIMCEVVFIDKARGGLDVADSTKFVTYNPRKCENWIDRDGNDIDKAEYERLDTLGKSIWITKE